MRRIQPYVLKDKQIFVGLEDSKRTWKLCVRSEGMMVHRTFMPADYDNLRSYLRNRYPGCRVKLIYEAGFAGFWLHDLLVADGFACVVTPAHRVTQPKVSRVKTDKSDSFRLALILENGDYSSCWVPDRELREDRQISRTLDQTIKDIKAAKNRIRRMLDYHGLNCGLPEGAWSDADYLRLDSLELGYALRVSVDAKLELLKHLLVTRERLKGELKRLSEKGRYRDSVKAKRSVPGIGWLSAIRLTLEWGDLSRFKTGKHLASFTGLTCSEYSSGESVRRGRITGQSSEAIRAWLIQCAWRAIRLDPVLLDKFRRVAINSGSRKKAIVAVARTLATRLRAVELTRMPYCIGLIE
jgi:transposase